MFRLSRWIIPLLLAVLGTSMLLMQGCKGAQVTVTIPPVTFTAPPITLTATLTATTTPGQGPASVTLTAFNDSSKINTMNTLAATVTSENGTLMPGVSVEWILNRVPDAVGDIVSLGGASPQKMNNTWGIVKTDSNGQARLTITSVHEGDTYIMVYVPSISNLDNQKIYVINHWVTNTN